MQQNPSVTVICLCYNHADYVIESLNSVTDQDYKNIDLIIIDDASTDNSVLVIEGWLKNYPKITFIKNATNLGNTKSFNKGLIIAKGEYIIDLAADDVLEKNCVTTQLHQFATSTYENVGIVYGNAAMIDENGNFIETYFPIDANGKLIDKRTSGNEYKRILAGGKYAMCTVSSMIKKEVYTALNGYDETLSYEDLDFWIRASRVYNFDFIDEVLLKKRVLHNSMSTHFYKKNSALNHSTYIILRKALALNKTKEEDSALQKRVHHEIINTWQYKNYDLFFKNIGLRIKIAWRKWLKKYSSN
jgi:glycosyltransferase involved in cell wall biosynthesis